MTVWGYVWLTAVCWIAADVLLVAARQESRSCAPLDALWWWVRMMGTRK